MASQEIIGYLGIFLGLIAIFFAVKHYRDSKLGGKITFGRAFGLGMIVATIAGVIVGIFTMVLLAWFYPDFGKEYLAYSHQTLDASGLPPEQIALKKLELEQMAPFLDNLPFQGVVMALTVAFIGLLHSLVSALILRRN